MIEKVRVNSLDKRNTPSSQKSMPVVEKHQQAFTGLGEFVLRGIQECEKKPMVNVSVLDLSTAILPRTYFETVVGSKKTDENGNPVLDENGKQKRNYNFFGGFEAFRRESSGLIVNCLIPSFIVMGAAWLFKPLMGQFNKSNLINTWANGDTYDKIFKFYDASKGATKENFTNTYKDMLFSLSGIDGDKEKQFKELLKGNIEVNQAFDDLGKAAFDNNKKLAAKAYETIVKHTHISENIKFAGDDKYFSNNLESLCKDTAKVLHGVKQEGIKTTEDLYKYIKNAKKLVNAKSIAGLGIIIPLAISMQPINRWITRKLSGRKGAPIYNDFSERKEDRELTPKEKSELLRQKFISVGSMIGVAGLSMFMDRPSLKSLFQFKGLFPTMDQARIISTATFASRMAASEDRNELREATIRDIATFSSFYFLGDYAAKAIASLIEALNGGKVKLINRFGKSDPNANIFAKFWNWAKHTSLKSTDELATQSAKNLRSICQLGNLAFSLISLGVFIPLYTRTQTNKKEQERLTKLNSAATNAASGGAGTQAAAAAPANTSAFPAAKAQSFKAFFLIRKEKIK